MTVATVANQRLYAMGDLGGYVVVDVTDPVSITVLGDGDLGLPASHVAVSEGFLFASGDGVSAADVRDPGSPTSSGTCRMPGDWARNVAVGSAGVYVTDRGGVWYWTDPAVVEFDCPRRVDAPSEWGIYGPMAVSGTRGFVARAGVEPAGVWGVDLSVLDAPRMGGRSADLPKLGDVAAEGDYAFAISERGLHVIDGRDVDAPLLRDNIELYGGAYWYRASVSVDDGLLAAAGREFRQFDMADPERPMALGSISSTEIGAVVVHGNLAFLSGHVEGSCTHYGMHVVDVGDPHSPHVVAAVCESGAGPIAVTGVHPIQGEGSVVYVGYGISNPSGSPAVSAYYVPPSGRVPFLLATALLPADPYDLAVSDDGHRLWVADAAGGVFEFEVGGGGLWR